MKAWEQTALVQNHVKLEEVKLDHKDDRFRASCLPPVMVPWLGATKVRPTKDHLRWQGHVSCIPTKREIRVEKEKSPWVCLDENQ